MNHEQLSRLLAGDLDDAEAAALHDAIDADPELRAAWQAMQTLAADLDALPLEVEPPPLPDPILSPAPPPANRPWLPWLIAAAALLFALWPQPRPERVLTAGSQWVRGDVQVLAGDLAVDVHGTARISVEPGTPSTRVGGRHQENPMDKTSIIAAAAGALVTIAVYEGTAVVQGPDVQTTTVAAGDVATLSTRPQARVRSPDRAPTALSSSTTTGAVIAQLEEELRKTKAELKTAQVTGAVTRGQLSAHMGDVSEWPADLRNGLSRDQFEDNLTELLGDVDGADIATVECAEYPCVAAVRLADPELQQDVLDKLQIWAKDEVGEERLRISANRSSTASDEGPEEHLLIFGAYAGERDDNVGVRLETRMDTLLDEVRTPSE